MTDPNTILAVSENISTSLVAIADSLPAVTAAAPIVADAGSTFDTALFYTFSTIAQTLAGAFAILGAFIMFKIQNIIRSFRKLGELFNQVYSAFTNSIPNSYHLENWEEYLFDMKNFYEENYESAEYTGYTLSPNQFCYYLEIFEKNFDLKKSISEQIGFAFFSTAITIMLALISLPFVPQYTNAIPMLISLITAIVLTLICILLYGSLLFTALEIESKLAEYVVKGLDLIYDGHRAMSSPFGFEGIIQLTRIAIKKFKKTKEPLEQPEETTGQNPKAPADEVPKQD